MTAAYEERWGPQPPPPPESDDVEPPHDAHLADHNPEADETAQTADLFATRVSHEVDRMRVRAAARRRLEQEDAADAPPLDAALLTDILARPAEPPQRVDQLIPSDAGTLLVAQRKTGKTTITLNLARSLVTGEPFLGRFDVRPITGTVAFLNYEVSGAQLGRWAHEVHVDPTRFLQVNLRGRRNPLARDDDRHALAHILRTHDVETLIVDPFGRAYTGQNQNDAGEVGAWLADLDRFARGDAAVTDVILTAHAGWNGERTRGSTALEDWADSIITLTRAERDNDTTRFLRAEGRDVDIDEDELAFDPTTRRLTLTGAGSRRAATQTRHVAELVTHVVQHVKAHPGCSKNNIETGVKGRRDAIREAIAQAVASGAIWQDTTGGRIAHHTSLAQPRPTSPRANPTDLAPSPIGGEGEGETTTDHNTGEGEPNCDTCQQPLLLNNGRTTCEGCRHKTNTETP